MRRLGLALIGCAAFVSLLAAQLKVDVALVNIVATVTDDRGRYITDLEQEDFIVEEDGQAQEIAHFTYSDDLPVSVGIVLDTSGSMDRKIATATAAVERFTRKIHEDDDIFLMTFAQTPTLRQDFTGDRNKLASALRKVRVGGGTALYDALTDGLKKIKTGKYTKKAVLLITDGQDTESYSGFNEASSAVRESEMLVYCLGISPSSQSMSEGVPVPTGRRPVPGGRRGPTINIPGVPGIPGWPGPFPGPFQPQGRSSPQVSTDTVDMEVLNAFASASGGKAWLLSGNWDNDRTNRMQTALDEIADELRNQYSIGYYPEHPFKDGKWHRIEIRAKNPRYHVRARKDYFGQ